MKSWSEIESKAQAIVGPFLGSDGRANGRLEGAQYLFDLLPLLQQSKVLTGSNKRFSHLTILLFLPTQNDSYVSIIPPGPMLNGTVEQFTVALHSIERDDYKIIKEENFHYQDMDKLIQVIEDYFLEL